MVETYPDNWGWFVSWVSTPLPKPSRPGLRSSPAGSPKCGGTQGPEVPEGELGASKPL